MPQIATERIYEALGKRITLVRGLVGMTQTDLAAKLKLTRTSLCNIEAGRQRVLLHFIPKIAKALHVKPDALMKGIWR